ncbi:hypothetical protein [Flagellimonas pacifica]|nr:hypothetical protein [Allomuricauda parva]
MIKKGVVIGIIFLWILSGCKSKTRENTVLKLSLPQIVDVSEDLNYIFTDGFSFTDNLRIDKIGMKRIDEHQYKIFYFFSDTGCMEQIEVLNIAFRVYPKKPMEFNDKLYQKNKARTIAAKCVLNRMADNIVVASDIFALVPKTFNETKIYLYKPETGIVGRTMTILDLNFDF